MLTRNRLVALDALERTAIAGTLYALSHLPLFDASPLVSATSARFPVALQRWDALHFLGIAQRGYAYEQNWAFLPGAPFIMHALGRIFGATDAATLALLGSLAALCCSTVRDLYDLTLQLTSSPGVAALASALSLVPMSPATLLFAPYMEPFFTFLSYKGMLLCARRRYTLAALVFTAASCFRSNGILLAGFIAWPLVVEPLLKTGKISLLLSPTTLKAALLSLLPIAPLLIHQYRGYIAFCTADVPAEWCSARFPLIYSAVQRKYWDVGFLRYWTPQQVPNFLLAAPVYALLFTGSFVHLRSRLSSPRKGHRHVAAWFYSKSLTPHALHAVFLSLSVFLGAHVQIMLRLGPSMPFLYWSAAWLWVEHPVWGRRWITWSAIWATISLVLWAAFLPPA